MTGPFRADLLPHLDSMVTAASRGSVMATLDDRLQFRANRQVGVQSPTCWYAKHVRGLRHELSLAVVSRLGECGQPINKCRGILPRPARNQFPLVQPHTQATDFERFTELFDRRLIFAVVAKKHIKGGLSSVGRVGAWITGAGFEWRFGNLAFVRLTGFDFQFRDLLLSFPDLLLDRESLSRVAGDGFFCLKKLEFSPPFVDWTLAHLYPGSSRQGCHGDAPIIDPHLGNREAVACDSPGRKS